MELTQLETMLKDEQVEVRIEAVRLFSQQVVFDPQLFVQMLGDRDWRVRKEAASQFLLMPNAGGQIAFVVDQLRHPENAGLRNAAIEILIGLGARATAELLRQLSESDAEIRKFIVDILGEIGHTDCVTELLPYLQDEDENVRYAVVETLGKLKAEESVVALLDLLDCSDAGLRFVIFDALSNIGSAVSVARILPYSDDPLLRKAVFVCLGELGNPQALPTLIAGLSDPLRKAREAALLAAGSLIGLADSEFLANDGKPLTAEQLAQITSYIEHSDPAYRRAACHLLSLSFDKQLFLQVLPLLADEQLRQDVIAASKRVAPELLTELLETVSLTDTEAIYLIFIAGELKNTAVTSLAIEALSSDDPQLRYAAVMTLGKISAFEAIELLGNTLADEIPDIREAASEALRQLGQSDAIMVIQAIDSALESEQPVLRKLAVRTLGGLDMQEVESYLLQAIKDADPEVRCEALRSLKGVDSQRALTGLSIALTDEDSDVRRLAASALEDFPAEKRLNVLSHVLDDPDPWVRMAAVKSLLDVRPHDAVPLLEKGLADSVGVVIIAALETIVQVVPGRAQHYLVQALSNSDYDVVKKAVSLLLQIEQHSLLLSHQSKQVRLLAIEQLQLQEFDRWQLIFEQQLIVEPDPQVRQVVEEALRRGTAGV